MRNYDAFVERQWIENDNPDRDIAHAVFGLAEEVGEISEKLSFSLYEKNGLTTYDIASEIGDVMFYLTKAAHFNNYKYHDIADIPTPEEVAKDDGESFMLLVAFTGRILGRYKRHFRPGDVEINPQEIFLLMREVFKQLSIIALGFGYCPDDVIKLNIKKLTGRNERGTLVGEGDDR